jgi:hypothetical protein
VTVPRLSGLVAMTVSVVQVIVAGIVRAVEMVVRVVVPIWMDAIVLVGVLVVVGGGIVVSLLSGVVMLVRVLDVEVTVAMGMGMAHSGGHQLTLSVAPAKPI